MNDTSKSTLPSAPPAGGQGTPAPDTPPETKNQNPKTIPSRQRRGTVARLPKDLRDRINQLLDDGLAYCQIVSELAQDARDLQPEHIRRWKAGGYQDYLREQRLIRQCRARTDRALQLLRQSGHIHAFQATQQIATAQICETLADAGPEILREALAANPLNYFRMLNAFSRLTAGGLKCERLLDEQAQTAAQAQPSSDAEPKKGLSQGTLKEMNDKLQLL